jgi:hypothetical protein
LAPVLCHPQPCGASRTLCTYISSSLPPVPLQGPTQPPISTQMAPTSVLQLSTPSCCSEVLPRCIPYPDGNSPLSQGYPPLGANLRARHPQTSSHQNQAHGKPSPCTHSPSPPHSATHEVSSPLNLQHHL